MMMNPNSRSEDSPYREDDATQPTDVDGGSKASRAPSKNTANKSRPSGGAGRKKSKRPVPVIDAGSVLNAFRAPDFTTVHLPEPQLIFGNSQREVDPKTGLSVHKPYDLTVQGRRTSYRLGVVGSGATIDATYAWLERCRGRVPAVRMRRDKGLIVQKAMDPTAYPPFPGIEEAFAVEIVVGENMTSTLTEAEIASVLKLTYFEEKITTLIRLIVGRIGVLSEGMHVPDAVIVALPTAVRDGCTIPAHHKTRGKQRPTLADALRASLEREKKAGQQSLFDVAELHRVDLDALAARDAAIAEEQAVFRHGLKAKAMVHGIPIQLAWQTTLEGGPNVEDDATRAWNFWTGVYYKCGGIPWRVAGLERGTCYAGISFYRDRSDGSLRTSMAQVFSDTGEGHVLRGEPFKWSPTRTEKSPHLPKDLAKDLMKRIIAAYENVHQQLPRRIVVHKWQRYYPGELEGLLEAISEAKSIHSYDLISFGDRGIRFFRAGHEPPLRGTMVTLAPDNVLLYTRGFIPYLGEYPGMRVPRPIEIVEHFGSAPMRKICEEVLSLTKMDWNSAVFAGKDPITTAFSEDVGDILAELKHPGEPRTTYRYYM
jgi:hypothetical protein